MVANSERVECFAVDTDLEASPRMPTPDMMATEVHKVAVLQDKTGLRSFRHSLGEVFFPDDPLHRFKNKPFFKKVVLALQYFFPIFDWGAHYNLKLLKSDAISGITIASLAIPQIGFLPEGVNPSSVSMLHFKGPHSNLALKTGMLRFITMDSQEAIAVGRTFASMKNYQIDGNKEMVAVGAMNMAGSCGFARSAINFNAGCKTAASNIIMASVVLFTMLLLMPLFHYTPNVILSAIIISAVIGLIDVRGAILLWKVDKFDFVACMSAFLGVLLISVPIGLIISVSALHSTAISASGNPKEAFPFVLQVGISVLKILFHVTRPNITVMGNIPGTNSYRNLAQYKEATRMPSFLILGIESPVYFTNSVYLQERLVYALVQRVATVCNSTCSLMQQSACRILRWIREEEERITNSKESPLKCIILDMAENRTDSTLVTGAVRVENQEIVGHQASSDPAKTLEERAATKVQAAFRGYQDDKKLDFSKMQLSANRFVCKVVFSWLDRWTSSHFWSPLPRSKKSVNVKSRVRCSSAVESESVRLKSNVHKNVAAKVDVMTESERHKRITRKMPSPPADFVVENPQSEIEKVKRSLRKVPNSTKEPSENQKPTCTPRKVTNSLSDSPQVVNEHSSMKIRKDSVVSIDSKLEIVAAVKSVASGGPENAVIDDSTAIKPHRPEEICKEESISNCDGELSLKDEPISNEIQKSSKRRASFPPKPEPFADNASQNAPRLPSYMATTESAKAKLRGQVSPRVGSDSAERYNMTRRHSLPTSTNGKLNSQSSRAHKLIQASYKDGIRNDRSFTSSRDGSGMTCLSFCSYIFWCGSSCLGTKFL
ncbi:hypothetical protein BHE74_00021094 [Ensete ventricosum]|nr:hypothetical protein BHE74_00021094 [Ensete ventricosum]